MAFLTFSSAESTLEHRDLYASFFTCQIIDVLESALIFDSEIQFSPKVRFAACCRLMHHYGLQCWNCNIDSRTRHENARHKSGDRNAWVVMTR
jgi:hypothetical protein